MVDGETVRGVRLAGGEILGAGEVIVSAGAYGSPALLLRSGIGPAADLAALGIVPSLDLPGVGSGLADHPLAEIPFATSADTPSPLPGLPSHSDGFERQSPDRGPRPAGLSHVRRSGGTLGRLPLCQRDTARLQGARRAALRAPGRPAVHRSWPSQRPGRPGGLAEAEELARALAARPPLSDLVTRELRPETPIVERTSTYHHPVGTCRMGPAGDPGAVVDHAGRVHGMARLRVVDASIMPSIPAANTNLPTMMVAERIASFMTSSEDA